MKLKDFPDSPVVKILRFQCRGRVGLIPGLGTKIPHAEWHGQKKKKKKSIMTLEETSKRSVDHSQHLTSSTVSLQ